MLLPVFARREVALLDGASDSPLVGRTVEEALKERLPLAEALFRLLKYRPRLGVIRFRPVEEDELQRKPEGKAE